MSWQTTLITYVRTITDDIGPNAVYSDETLESLIIAAAVMVNQSVDFDTDYSINIEAVTITPDPSNDEAFVYLVGLKTACLLARAEQKKKARNALQFKDGPSNIDGRASAEATAKWSDTICKDYSDAELDFHLGNSKPGKAIVGPYRYDNSSRQAGISERYNSDQSHFS